MAAVSAAMLRPPGGGLDPPYYTSQRMNYSPPEDMKSKKSWGQRLKLGSNGNDGHGTLRAAPGTTLYGTVSSHGGSALSKSMKYAEPWLYGTVRAAQNQGRPGIYLQYADTQSPVLISTPQSQVQNYAVVVCSCPEYLNGTKKGSSKKVSICKKCKGSRLPLGVPVNGTVRGQMMGGTVRGPPAMRSSGGTLRAGTVKLSTSSKSRPTILSLTPQNQPSDPYDMMRRTRLSSPLESNHVGSQFTASRSRAKSISPVRNRGRRRSPSTDTLKLRSKSVNRSMDLWCEDNQNYDNDLINRRSILECDVNPYDLMQRMKVEKLRPRPENDDEDDVFADFENDETFTLKKLKENLNTRHSKKGAKHNGPYSNVQAIGGQRIRVFGQSSTPSVEEEFVYDDVEVNRQPIKINKDGKGVDDIHSKEKNNVISSKNNGSNKEQKFGSIRSSKARSVSPKRPPRRVKTETSEEESESDRKENKQKSGVTKQLAVNNSSVSFVAANRSADPTIKSILKKPRGERPVLPEVTPPSPPPDRRLSGSHFYLPTPQANKSPGPIVQNSALQRKKVQFLVENEIVSSPDRINPAAESPSQEMHKDLQNLIITEVTVSVNNERKSSLSSDDLPEGLDMDDENGSHNLVNTYNAKNIIQNSSSSSSVGGSDYEDTVETRSQSTESAAGSVEQTSDEDAAGSDIRVRMYAQEVAVFSSTAQQDSPETNQSEDNNDVSLTTARALRRSQSERLIVQGSPESPSFLDTMALRPRPLRAHSRQAFVSTQSLVEIINVDKPSRPRDRPPPPPSPSSSDSSEKPSNSSITILCTSPLSHQAETINNIDKQVDLETILNHSAEVESCFEVQNVSNDVIQLKNKIEKNGHENKQVRILPAPPPRSKPKETKVIKTVSTKKEPSYVKTRFVRGKNNSNENNIVSIESEEKSTVQVSSETPRQVFASGVHRLSITQNDDTDNNDSTHGESHRKTSIMISGDDCYSTVNVNNDTPIYQSSVTINGDPSPNSVKNTGNSVTISVYSESDESNSEPGSRHSNQIYIHNKNNSSYSPSDAINNSDGNLLNASSPTISSPGKTLVVVDYETLNRDDMITVTSPSKKKVNNKNNELKRGIKLDFSSDTSNSSSLSSSPENTTTRGTRCNENISDMTSTTEDISVLLRDPVEAVKRNLVPHVCGKAITETSTNTVNQNISPIKCEAEVTGLSRNDFVAKLLEDPMLGHLAEGLDSDLVAKLIENSLLRLKQSRKSDDYKGNQDDEAMSKLIDASLLKLQEEKSPKPEEDTVEAEEIVDLSQEKNTPDKDESAPASNRNSICSQTNSTGNNICSAPYESMEYESGLMGASSDAEPLSDCYNASASELSTEEDNSTRSKFYQMLVDATLSEIEISNTVDDDHHYESIRLNADPIYEEICDMPPPLPLNPPPASMIGLDDDKKQLMTRSIFEGASKYDILSYLVDAKERGIVPEDSYTFNFNTSNDMTIEEEADIIKEPTDHQRQSSDLSSRVSNLSNGSDSSEDSSLIITAPTNDKTIASKKSSSEVERNDSGVGSETSKCSRSRWQSHNIPHTSILDNNTPIHLCEDCDGAVETQVTDSGVMYAPLVCRKCGKKRAERKEIITEIVETEEKYGRDLQIILEEFYQPMLVAGLLTQEQLSAIFLNVEELLENNQSLAERLRDALEIAVEQGDEDLLTVNIGKLMLESAPMLHAFSSYCVRQGSASLLLSSLEKEKELLRIFLKVSQMENAVLRRMNLNSFLMVPVQRVTKYPLLLSRLFKVTPPHVEGRDLLRQAQQRVELHLSHMNSEAKDVTSLRLWRRISSGAGAGGAGRRGGSEADMINIKLRKMAVDVLEWNHDEARFAMEGKLLFTQPNDNNWRKGRTIKLSPINALLVTNGKPTAAYKPGEGRGGPRFPRNTGVREASLLLVREKGGRAALLREPLYLDRCVVAAADGDWDDYFELQEIVSKDTFIFKAEDSARTKQWCQQLQYHSQGMGAWRKRRNALANIMINGMMTRN